MLFMRFINNLQEFLFPIAFLIIILAALANFFSFAKKDQQENIVYQEKYHFKSGIFVILYLIIFIIGSIFSFFGVIPLESNFFIPIFVLLAILMLVIMINRGLKEFKVNNKIFDSIKEMISVGLTISFINGLCQFIWEKIYCGDDGLCGMGGFVIGIWSFGFAIIFTILLSLFFVIKKSADK